MQESYCVCAKRGDGERERENEREIGRENIPPAESDYTAILLPPIPHPIRILGRSAQSHHIFQAEEARTHTQVSRVGSDVYRVTPCHKSRALPCRSNITEHCFTV